MKAYQKLALFVLLLSLLLAGCRRGQQRVGPTMEPVTVSGKVIDVPPDGGGVTLDLAEAPGLKGGKTQCRVENSKLVEGFKPGDTVTVVLKLERGIYWLMKVESPAPKK